MHLGRSSAHQTLPYALRLEQKLLRRGAGARSGDALQLVTAGSLCICFIQQTNASGMGSEAPLTSWQPIGEQGQRQPAFCSVPVQSSAFVWTFVCRV